MADQHARYLSKHRGHSEVLQAHYAQHGCKLVITQEEELIYLPLDEALKVWLTLMEQQGEFTSVEAKTLWEEWRQSSENVAKYFSASKDSAIAAIVAKDLGRHVGKTRTAVYGGKVHIIFKGNQTARTLLTGTKYGLTNPNC